MAAVAGILFALCAVIGRADTVTAGSTVMLSVTADGTSPFTYQWSKDGTNISGANTPSLTIANVQSANAGNYAVLVANSAGSTTSDVSSIVVAAATTAPVITSNPVSQNATVGANVTFTGSASGAPAPTFQWKKNGTNISGATSSSLTLTNIQLSSAATYTVLATNSAGSAASAGAVLTVTAANLAPSISTQPLSQSVVAGVNVTFTAASTGTPSPTYQWQKNGSVISGATSATLTLTSVQASAAGTYRVVATNSVGSATSIDAVLTVGAANAAPVITLQPQSQTATVGGNVTFTTAASGTPTPTFQWKKNGASITGATSNSYAISSASSGSAGTYTVVATNSVGSVTSTGAVLTMNAVSTAPVITTQPQSQCVIPGSNVTFTVAASGSPAPAFQWKKNGANIAGAVGNSYSIIAADEGDFGIYTVVASNTAGSVTSNPCTLSFSIADNGDFDGDGKTDLIWTNTVTGDRVMWLMDGTAIRVNTYLGNVPLSWVVSGTGDFDGDGKADIFWTNTATGDRAVWLMNGGTIKSGAYMGAVSLAWTVAGTGDFDGDGKADIFWSNVVTGERAVWMMNGGTLSSGASLGFVPVAWSGAGTGDFNGDGKSDILLTNTVTGDRVLWVMNGAAIGLNSFLGTVPPSWSVSGTGDFDGDGKADILWTNTATGDRAMWLMNGSKAKTGAYLGNVSTAWIGSGNGDFDGDGKADIFWSNTVTGDKAMWIMNGGVATSGSVLGSLPLEWSINY